MFPQGVGETRNGWSSARRVISEYLDQLPGLSYGQKPQHHRVNQAKDGGVGSDAEGQRENSHRRNQRRTPENTQRVAAVLYKDLHQVSAAGFAALFPEFFMPAELDARPPLRFRASQARMLQVIGAVLHVCAQLLVRIVLDAPAVDQRSDERAKRRQQAHISSGCVLSADAIAAARRFQPSACWRRRLRPAGVSS